MLRAYCGSEKAVCGELKISMFLVIWKPAVVNLDNLEKYCNG